MGDKPLAVEVGAVAAAEVFDEVVVALTKNLGVMPADRVSGQANRGIVLSSQNGTFAQEFLWY